MFFQLQASLLRACTRNRNYILKLIGISTVAAMTIRLIYNDTYAFEKSRALFTQEENEHLVSVLMLTRHGARTPLHLVYKLDEAEYKQELMEPYVKAKYKLKKLDNSDFDDILSFYDQRNFDFKLKGGIGRGQLTKVGEKQMFDLGRRVRERYVQKLNFLSKNYDPNEIYTRSTHYRRTINSAKSVLAGIYLDNHASQPEEPFVINVQDLHEDCLFPNPLNCSYFAEMYKFLEKLSLYTSHKEYMENLMELNQVLTKLNGPSNKSYSFTAFRDDMLARQVHDLHVPKDLEEFVIKSDRYAAMELTAQTKHNLKISCGMLLDLLKENLLASLENDLKNKNTEYHKFRYYSAHDSTLNALLAAFDLIDDDVRWPPFAADLTIELWKTNRNNADYFVRLFYCGQPVRIPNCTDTNGTCDLNKFINILEKNVADKHTYSKLCSQKFIE